MLVDLPQSFAVAAGGGQHAHLLPATASAWAAALVAAAHCPAGADAGCAAIARRPGGAAGAAVKISWKNAFMSRQERRSQSGSYESPPLIGCAKPCDAFPQKETLGPKAGFKIRPCS